MFFNVSHDCAEEKLVWLNVVRRATFDYVLYKGKKKFEIRWARAHAFLFGEEKLEDGLTFEEICGVFTWDVGYVRRLIKTMGRSDIRKLEPTKFREDFCNDTAPPTTSFSAPKWECTNTNVPLFVRLVYSQDYRYDVTPRPVSLFERSFSTPPLLRVGARR